jgi:hypothetical protein
MDVKVIYRFNGEIKKLNIQFTADQSVPLQQLNLVHDKNTPVYGIPLWTDGNGKHEEGAIKELGADNYLYFLISEN